jgi:hypothetical protein
MNVWKPIALVMTAGLVASVGMQFASAGDGPCKNQPHMKAARIALGTAQNELGQAEWNKGGWLPPAQASVASAITAVENGCIAADKGH